MAHLRLSLLGTFRVTLDSAPITSFGYDKVRALLALLVVEAERPHQWETLAGLLWPNQPERSARLNLSQALSRLRRAAQMAVQHGLTQHLLARGDQRRLMV